MPFTQALDFGLQSIDEDVFGRLLRTLEIPDEPRANWPDEVGQRLRMYSRSVGAYSPKVLSVFSGAGGLDIGFHDAGFDVVEMVEIEPRFAHTLHYNSGAGKYLGEARVRTIDVREYVCDLGHIDFMIGGPPCQSFSAAGRRASGVMGTDDDRGLLFREYVRLLEELQPEGFLFENVYGITGAQNGSAWLEICAAFREAGYEVSARVLDAADYGVPQHRERLFIVGVKPGRHFAFPRPTHGPDSGGRRPFRTASDALSGLPVGVAQPEVDGRYGRLLREIPPGLNYSFYTKEMGHPHPVFAWRSKFSDFLYKADPEHPIRTLKANGGKYTGPFHWHSRPFDIDELKRLQTFPDRYAILGSTKNATMQIGNSVPPQLARLLAYCVMQTLFEVQMPVILATMRDHDKLSFRRRKRNLTDAYASKAREAFAGGASAIRRSSPIMLHDQVYSLSDALEPEESTNGQFIARSEMTNEALSIAVRMKRGADDFEISLLPKLSGWLAPYKRILLKGSIDPTSNRWDAFVLAWKLLEMTLADAGIAADIVQLSGYYQYPPQFSCEIDFASSARCLPFAGILERVTRGLAVGATLAIEEVAEIWAIPSTAVRVSASLLRQHGFEVRNSATNPQIPRGQMLIPYCFPTLNSQSVQFHKSLGW